MIRTRHTIAMLILASTPWLAQAQADKSKTPEATNGPPPDQINASPQIKDPAKTKVRSTKLKRNPETQPIIPNTDGPPSPNNQNNVSGTKTKG